MEQNLRICKICKQMKKRIMDGKFDEKNKRWKDENGKLWSGSYCPDCNKERVKIKMRIKRNPNVL